MFTVPELQLMSYVLQVDSEGKAKNYPLGELTTAFGVMEALKTCTKDGEKVGDKLFIEGKIDFTTEQKTFILKSIEGRGFTVGDAEAVFSVQKKLK